MSPQENIGEAKAYNDGEDLLVTPEQRSYLEDRRFLRGMIGSEIKKILTDSYWHECEDEVQEALRQSAVAFGKDSKGGGLSEQQIQEILSAGE